MNRMNCIKKQQELKAFNAVNAPNVLVGSGLQKILEILQAVSLREEVSKPLSKLQTTSLEWTGVMMNRHERVKL